MDAIGPAPERAAPPPRGAWGPLRAALAAVALAALAVAVLRRPGWILEALEAARAGGPAGRLLYLLVYVVAGLLALPVTPLSVGAGHAFGPVMGALVAAPGACLGSCAGFVLGRTLLHGPVARRLARDRRLGLIAGALRRRGREVVMLLRLSPLVPFPVLAHVAGATPMRLRDFAAGSLLGVLPSSVVAAWLGSLVPSARQAVAPAPGSWPALAALIAATAAGTLLARRALLRALAEEARERGAEPEGGSRPRAAG